MNADGGNQHQLTFTDTSNERDPTFSPDGQQIILERNAGGPSEEIVLMNADGSGAHVIGPPGQDPQFSPDGKLIVFSSNFGGTPVNEIWVMNADGTNAHALTSSASGQQNTEPSFSPDSRTIAWDRLDPSSWEIWAMNADGSGQRQLTNDDFEADTPAFAPDGAHLIWDQDNGMGDDNIALMAATGGPISFLTQIANEAVDPDWQPIPVVCDGRRATLVGTAGADNLLGTSAADVIAGLEGKDTISGLQGKDRLCGGPGKDVLKGGSGNDRLFGQAGNDKLRAGKGKKDRCVGGKGKDSGKGCEKEKSL